MQGTTVPLMPKLSEQNTGPISLEIAFSAHKLSLHDPAQ